MFSLAHYTTLIPFAIVKLTVNIFCSLKIFLFELLHTLVNECFIIPFNQCEWYGELGGRNGSINVREKNIWL